MKRTLLVTTSIVGSLLILWGTFCLGSYRAYRVSNALMTNEILVVRQMAIRGETPEAIAEKVNTIAKKLESASERTTFFDALHPSMLPAALSSSFENTLWHRNHELMAQNFPPGKAQ